MVNQKIDINIGIDTKRYNILAQYTTLDKATINQIADEFDIGEVEKWKVLHGGSTNTNYYVEAGRTMYVINILESDSIKWALDISRLLVYLEENNFRTNRIYKSIYGEYVLDYKNKKILLKEYIQGKIEDDMDNEILFKIGSQMAKLHSLSAPDYLPHSFSYDIDAFNESAGWNIDHPFIDWLSEKAKYIKGILHSELPRCLIHGDIFYDNVVISNEEGPVIIDFEEASYYYRIFDIGMAIVGLCRENCSINISKAKALLKGYQNHLSLTPLEIERLRAFIVYAAVATAFWRFKQFNIIYPGKNLENRYVEMQRIADSVYSSSDDLFGQ